LPKSPGISGGKNYQPKKSIFGMLEASGKNSFGDFLHWIGKGNIQKFIKG
jgi:hypothetical protein